MESQLNDEIAIDLAKRIAYTVRIIDSSFVVWIEQYDQFVQLAEPAYFVFSRYANGVSVSEIVALCSIKYKLNSEKSKAFVDEIIAGFNQIAETTVLQDDELTVSVPHSFSFSFYSSFQYKIGSKVYLFRYESSLYERYLHPLLEHLIVDNEAHADFVYELFTFNQRTVLRHNGNLLGDWNSDESQYIKGAVFVQLLNDMYDKSKTDWMATLHASAVSNTSKAIVFSAASGSGKSTLGALLKAHGYKLLSDDFVAIDKDMQQAHPFPIAVSVKDGALNVLLKHFPELKEQDSRLLSGNRSGRYLPSDAEIGKTVVPKPVRELVFVEYTQEVDFEMYPIDRFVAMQLLIDESWILPIASNVEAFLAWISTMNFFKLRYSDNKKAIEAIDKMFLI